MAGGVIPGLDFARRRRFHLSRKDSSESPLSVASRSFTRQPSSSSSSSLRINKPNQTHQEEKHDRKAKKSLDEKVRQQSKSQNRREISCRTTATRDLYQSSSPSSPTDEDERLGVEAKMAKERLDKRLRPYLKSQTNKEISLQINQVIQWKETIHGCGRFDWILMKRINQVIQWKETIHGCGRFDWILMKRKTYEQEACAVCLEELRNGESLDRLPCGHKFHSHCLRRWLQINPHCPYCRSKTIP